MPLPASIDELIAYFDGSMGRASTLLEQLTAEAAADNTADRIYTAIPGARTCREARRREALRTSRSAGSAQMPLFGVPIAVKDNIDLQGEPTSCGSIALARPDPARDAAIVREFERLGAVVLGKTNLDEAALGASGRNAHFGRCINPCAAHMLSGGSSSGSAAAVAKGHVPIAIGTDTLGSARIPAALCGVVGFKPSHGGLPMHGVAPLYPAFDALGLMTASLRDMELVCDALALGARSPASKIELPRIMLLGDSALIDVDDAVASHYRRCREELRRSAQLLASEFMAVDFTALSRAALWEVASEFAARIGFRTAGFAARRGTLGHELHRLLERACTLPDSKLHAGRTMLRDARQRIRTCFGGADALFTPTCPVSAIEAGAELPRGLAAFVVPANLAGLPAISWPQTVAPGRTISLQLIGRAGSDRSLIELAGKILTLLDPQTAAKTRNAGRAVGARIRRRSARESHHESAPPVIAVTTPRRALRRSLRGSRPSHAW